MLLSGTTDTLLKLRVKQEVDVPKVIYNVGASLGSSWLSNLEDEIEMRKERYGGTLIEIKISVYYDMTPQLMRALAEIFEENEGYGSCEIIINSQKYKEAEPD